MRRLVEDERARDMPRALVLIAFVHLRQQLAITLRGEDVLCLKEPCNPRRRRGLDDETIRRSFDAHRNVAGGYVDAGAAPVDAVLRQLADPEGNRAGRRRVDRRGRRQARFEFGRPCKLVDGPVARPRPFHYRWLDTIERRARHDKAHARVMQRGQGLL